MLFTLKYARYLKQNEGKIPFPLDGSNWARLVSIRLERSRRVDTPKEEDLISRYHNNSEIIGVANHALNRSGLQHWGLL